jgi:hypothetical protein
VLSRSPLLVGQGRNVLGLEYTMLDRPDEELIEAANQGAQLPRTRRLPRHRERVRGPPGQRLPDLRRAPVGSENTGRRRTRELVHALDGPDYGAPSPRASPFVSVLTCGRSRISPSVACSRPWRWSSGPASPTR